VQLSKRVRRTHHRRHHSRRGRHHHHRRVPTAPPAPRPRFSRGVLVDGERPGRALVPFTPAIAAWASSSLPISTKPSLCSDPCRGPHDGLRALLHSAYSPKNLDRDLSLNVYNSDCHNTTSFPRLHLLQLEKGTANHSFRGCKKGAKKWRPARRCG